MFTLKDVETRSIFVINCIEERALQVESGQLLLKDTEKDKKLTKLPFQKILALFIIGHITITTALIDKCTKYGIPLIVMKPNFRPVFFFSITAEANYLLRQKQHKLDVNDMSIPKILVKNKIRNQLQLLINTRKKSELIEIAKAHCTSCIEQVEFANELNNIMGIEGRAAKYFFSAYFEDYGWQVRRPRTKCDTINATLDIGYTILFNYIEAYLRLFGFDPYIGVYHRLWFKRKSLICDLVEPFRCIIDRQVRKSFNTGQFKASDYKLYKNEYILKREKNSDYTKVFYDILIEYKTDVFKYIRDYYRFFMQSKSIKQQPVFEIK